MRWLAADSIDELVADVIAHGRAPGPRAGVARPRRPRRRWLRAARRRVHAPLGRRRAGDRAPHVGGRRAPADGPAPRLRRRPPGEQVHGVPAHRGRELAGRMGRSDALIEVWNGVPWFSPVWYRRPHMTILHHVHGPMWDQIMPPPFAGAGRLLEARLAPPFYRRTHDRHPVGGDARGAARARVPARPRDRRRQRRRPVLLTRRRPLAAPDRRRRRPPGAGQALRAAARRGRAGPRRRARPAGAHRRRGPAAPGARALDRRARRRGAGPTLLGHVPRGQLRDEYRRAWLVASASLAEGWGLSLTEGAACGTPGRGHRHQRPPLLGRRRAHRPARRARRPRPGDRRRARRPDRRARLGAAALARARTLTWDAVGARRAARASGAVVADEPRRGRAADR